MKRRNFLASLLAAVVPDTAVKRVLVMFKCHLDVGFVDTQANVVRKYFDQYFPQAIQTAAALRQAGSDRYIWTTGKCQDIARLIARAGPAGSNFHFPDCVMDWVACADIVAEQIVVKINAKRRRRVDLEFHQADGARPRAPARAHRHAEALTAPRTRRTNAPMPRGTGASCPSARSEAGGQVRYSVK